MRYKVILQSVCPSYYVDQQSCAWVLSHFPHTAAGCGQFRCALRWQVQDMVRKAHMEGGKKELKPKENRA